MSLHVKGVIVPTVTPFDNRGELDLGANARLVDFLINHGIAGLFPAGTTGEGPLLTTSERQTLAAATVEAAAGRVPVIVHSGAITTTETIQLTRHAQTIGADAAAVVPPYFYRHTQEALFKHFAAVAAAVPEFPIYLYNNPGVGNNNSLPLPLIIRLVEARPNIIGIKDSSGSLGGLVRLADLYQGNFNTATGGDGMILMGTVSGVDAFVSGNANVVPELVVALYRAAAAGQLDAARTLQQQLNQVRDLLEDGLNLSLFKAMLARRGLAVGQVRPPLVQVTETIIAERWQALTALNLALAAAPGYA
jgi:4-hydroxy-tetrahydrodipicolinate synthase